MDEELSLFQQLELDIGFRDQLFFCLPSRARHQLLLQLLIDLFLLFDLVATAAFGSGFGFMQGFGQLRRILVGCRVGDV